MTAPYERVTQKYTFSSSVSLKFHFEEDKENSIKNELGFVGFGGVPYTRFYLNPRQTLYLASPHRVEVWV